MCDRHDDAVAVVPGHIFHGTDATLHVPCGVLMWSALWHLTLSSQCLGSAMAELASFSASLRRSRNKSTSTLTNEFGIDEQWPQAKFTYIEQHVAAAAAAALSLCCTLCCTCVDDRRLYQPQQERAGHRDARQPKAAAAAAAAAVCVPYMRLLLLWLEAVVHLDGQLRLVEFDVYCDCFETFKT